MLTDAHCHPFDLLGHFPAAESERAKSGVMCAASSTTMDEFEYCERLSLRAKENAAAPLLPCFAVHPQMPAAADGGSPDNGPCFFADSGLSILETLAAQGRLAAVGETGFDLFNAAFRETEKMQDRLFAAHLETALRYDLPLVLHVRRAMHKIFSHAPKMRKCRSVIFHSWSGTAGEGQALLRRGINAYFSFGTAIALNHRRAMQCCAVFPAGRLLAETDAPFQPLRGRAFSSYADIPKILETMAALRGEAENEIENSIEKNFRSAFARS